MDTAASIISFDEDGFLTDPDAWSEALAEQLAQQDGLAPLTSEHWAVIRALRAHYQRFHAPPALRRVCHVNHMDKYCVDTLFAHNCREAWRIAGLPNPGEEAKAYL